jgi:hypothetical protein
LEYHRAGCASRGVCLVCGAPATGGYCTEHRPTAHTEHVAALDAEFSLPTDTYDDISF